MNSFQLIIGKIDIELGLKSNVKIVARQSRYQENKLIYWAMHPSFEVYFVRWTKRFETLH